MRKSLVIAGLLLLTSVSSGHARWIANKQGCQFWGRESSPTQLEIDWTGGCEGGKAQGEGVLTYHYRKEGEAVTWTFVGTMKDGSPYWGSSQSSDGQGDFTGRWKDGKPYTGRLSVASGGFMEGTFADGKLIGQGRMVLSQGIEYMGMFREGHPSGPGTMWLPNGLAFTGAFEDNFPAGLGACMLGDRAGRCRVSQDRTTGAYDVTWEND